MKILNSQHAVLDTQESLEFNLLIYQLKRNLEEEGSESFHFYTKKKPFMGIPRFSGLVLGAEDGPSIGKHCLLDPGSEVGDFCVHSIEASL